MTITATLSSAVRTLGCLVALVGSVHADAAEFFASNAAGVTSALQQAQPGDVVTMLDGTWTNQQIQFAADGMAGAPITLRAQTPGGVILNGNSTLSISGDHLIADGLRFEGGSLSSGNVVQFRGSNGEATNSRLTNSAIVDYNPADINTRYFWVSMYGQDNRVDHNYFSGQSHSGVTVTVWRDDNSEDRHLIDNNYFADRPEGNGNGFETIRVGTSAESLSDSFTVVENNLFERTDGEIEIISNKSGSNVFRYNTFRESAGTLTLRHGNETTVEGNFFIGLGKDGSGGVRVIGEDQTIINNYFNSLDGRAGGAISISAGVPNSAPNEYFQVKDAVIAHNTIVGVQEAAIRFDDGLGSSGRSLLAEDVTIANNLTWSNDTLFVGAEGANWTWEGNLAFGPDLGEGAGNPGITVADPQMVFGADGVWRLTSASTAAIDGGVSGYSGLLTTDMDGQPRIGAFDIGADEYYDVAAQVFRKPLNAEDVGPETWSITDPDPDPDPDPGISPGCGGDGCAIQAEAFTALLDPDQNGQTWNVVTNTDALGGQTLKAPSGNRVRIEEGQTHNAIATYDVEFETTGTYTAYYRARGFSGSNDSLFAPTDFDTDPDDAQSTTNTGQFRWETGGATFSVNGSLVGVPLELRIGMRESLTEFDALVLSLDANLTDAELDALFASPPGDYNGDGLVDVGDYTAWRDAFGQSGAGLAADGDGNGVVDGGDYAVWRNAFLGASSQSAAIPEPSGLAILLVTLAAAARRRTARLSSAEHA
ncbi:MAG: polysaccharide lyase 6 family protein [Planctomycetota bacterium]